MTKVMLRVLKSGKRVAVKPSFAQILVKLGTHEYIASPSEEPKAKRQYRRRDMQAASPKTDAASTPTYERTDLTAEGSSE